METMKIVIPEGSTLNGEMSFSIDAKLLPPWLQKTTREHAEAYGTPEELWIMAFLSGIAGAAGKKAKLVTGNYTNYPQLWTIIVGASGTGKSDPFRVAFKPLKKINDERFSEYQQRYQDWEATEKQGKAPAWKQLLISDTTPEALFPAIAHTDALILYRDELSGWFSDFGRYNKSGEVSHYLSLYNNDQVIINRKTDRPQLINDPFLNVCGTIQPGVLSDVLSRNNAEESGFAQRFLYFYPDFSPKKYNLLVKTPSTEMYEAVIGNIVGYTGRDEYTLSVEAEKEYERYFNDCEEKKYDGRGEFWSAVHSKAQIQVLRVALTVKIARLTDDPITEVSGGDMKAAVNIMNYCVNSLKKFKEEQGEQRRGEPTKKELIEAIFRLNPNANQTQLAQMLGVSREHVNRVSRKYHSSQFTPSRKAVQETDTENSGCDIEKYSWEDEENGKSHHVIPSTRF